MVGLLAHGMPRRLRRGSVAVVLADALGLEEFAVVGGGESVTIQQAGYGACVGLPCEDAATT